MVLPVTVRQSPCSRPASSSAFITTGTPPISSTSFMTWRPKGFTSARCGTLAPMRLKSARVRSTSASRAMASRCSTALVEPPNAMTTAMAFSKASLVRMSRAVMPRRSSSTTASPLTAGELVAALSMAGGAALPGNDIPSASAAAGHGVGGVHAAAGTLAGADGPLDGVDVLAAHQSAGAGADRFEGVDDGDFAFGAVGQLGHARHDRAGVEEHRGQVQSGGGHQHAGQRLVAAGQQHASRPGVRPASRFRRCRRSPRATPARSACPRGPSRCRRRPRWCRTPGVAAGRRTPRP